jgi:Protein of unknown function (DUF3054)
MASALRIYGTLLSCALFLSISPSIDSYKIFSRRYTVASRLYSSKRNDVNDDYALMKIDESKLSPAEIERLAFIQKLTSEADEIIKAAGFSLDDEELDEKMVQRPIKDTKWSGQSDVEESVRSRNNLNDVGSRRGLATGDAAALFVAAAVSRSYFGEGLDALGLLSSAVPFIASWLLISPFLGTFNREATSSKGAVPKGLALGWLISIPIAIAATEFFADVKSSPTSLIFTQVSVFISLGIWRLLYISLIGETSENEFKSAGFFEVFKMIKTLVKRW